MIPFQKIFTILIRTFSRPMLGYIKHKQQINKNNWAGNLFVWIGRRTFTIESWTSRRILKKTATNRPAEIKQEVLLEKGVQTFYEILFYLIVLGLPFWQLYKGSLAAQKKQEALQTRIRSLDRKLQQLNLQLKKTAQFLKKQSKHKSTTPTHQHSPQQSDSATPVQTAAGQAVREQEQKPIEMQELLQNALEVVADEFEDVLDELQLDSPGDDGQAAQVGEDLSPGLEDIEIEGSADHLGAQVAVQIDTQDLSQVGESL